MLVAIAFSSNLLLQIRDALSELDINSGTWKIDRSCVSAPTVRAPDAGEKPAWSKSVILLIHTAPRLSSCSEAF